MAEFDLRQPGTEVAPPRQLMREEITATALSPSQSSLVLGTSEGVVKVFDVNGLKERMNMNAFTHVMGRKGAVSRLRFHPQNGALFGASTVGCVKLLRLSV